jgi:hypothetical protein
VDRPRRAVRLNGTLIALLTKHLINLEIERAIPETCTAFDTFSASDTQQGINNVFKMRVFDEPPFDGCRRAKLIFRTVFRFGRLRVEKTGAEFTVAAHFMIMETLYRRCVKDTVFRTISASDTFMRVNLPDSGCVGFGKFVPQDQASGDSTKSRGGDPAAG